MVCDLSAIKHNIEEQKPIEQLIAVEESKLKQLKDKYPEAIKELLEGE